MGNCKLHEPYLGSLWPTWGWSADSSVSKAPSDVLKALVSTGQAGVIVDAARFEGRVIYGGGFWGGLQLSLIIPADVIIPSIIVGHLYAAVMMSSCNLRPQSLLINIACCGLQFWMIPHTTYKMTRGTWGHERSSLHWRTSVPSRQSEYPLHIVMPALNHPIHFSGRIWNYSPLAHISPPSHSHVETGPSTVSLSLYSL